VADKSETKFVLDLNAADKLKTAVFTSEEVNLFPPELRSQFKPVYGASQFGLPIDLERRLQAAVKAHSGQSMGVGLRRFLTSQTQAHTEDMKAFVSASLQVTGSEVLTIVLGRILEALPLQVIDKIQKDIALNLGLRNESP